MNKKHITAIIIGTILIAFSIYIINNNILNNNQITGMATADLNKDGLQEQSNEITEDIITDKTNKDESCPENYETVDEKCVLKKGCAYNNPACESGYQCADNSCRNIENSGGGSGGGSVPPLIDVGGY